MKDNYREIKPVLNKLSEYNVFDNLRVISFYVRAVINDKNYKTIVDVESPEYNRIEVYFADFLIANSIIYCTETRGVRFLYNMNDRARIYKPISELCDQVNIDLSHKEPMVWIVSYMFNQTNINKLGNYCIVFNRFFHLYNSNKIRAKVNSLYGFSFDHYIQIAFYIFSCFANDHFFCAEGYLFSSLSKDTIYFIALRKLLADISIDLDDLRQKCKDYCSYRSNRVFNYYNDAPHICYPLIRHDEGFCCVVPTYILSALLDGLYYKLDIPNNPAIRDEYASNIENYVGFLLKKAHITPGISYCSEITYTDGRQGNLKTSDWILWDKDAICFLDCKAKRISISGKHAVEIDDFLISKIIALKPFKGKEKRIYIDSLEEGITKDLINLGIGLGKVFMSYEAYKAGKIPGFPYDPSKEFYACMVTLEDDYLNTPGYKKRIIQIAQSYRNSCIRTNVEIDERKVRLLSVGEFEICTEMLADLGLIKCLETSPIRVTDGRRQVFDSLFEECKVSILNPLKGAIIGE